MNAYLKLDASFWCKDTEYPLYPIWVDESDDSIEIVTSLRHPDVRRGCIGNLILTAVEGRELDTFEEVSNQRDCYDNVLLGKIQVWLTSYDEAPSWKYIFLKD